MQNTCCASVDLEGTKPSHASVLECDDIDHSDFGVIHPLLFGLLMFVFPGHGQLRRVLCQNLVNIGEGGSRHVHGLKMP